MNGYHWACLYLDYTSQLIFRPNKRKGKIRIPRERPFKNSAQFPQLLFLERWRHVMIDGDFRRRYWNNTPIISNYQVSKQTRIVLIYR